MNISEEEAQELLKSHRISTDGQLRDKQGNPINAIAALSPEKLQRLREAVGIKKGNKYHAVRTWSNYSKRYFASKAEARRGEELYLRMKAGEISDLRYQVKFELFDKPKITYTADFAYLENGKRIVEDVKGVLTRDTRTKIAWVQQRYKIQVRLVK